MNESPATVSEGHVSWHGTNRSRTKNQIEKSRRNKNMKLCKPMNMAMKVAEEHCDSSDLMLKINKKQEIITNPSYLIMHALEANFSIMMHICTHDTEMWNGCVRRKHAVRLILVK